MLLASSTIPGGAWCASAMAETPAAAATTTVPSDPSVGLEAIVVTAQKRSENVQAVPLSIVAVSGQTLKNSVINGPLDVGKLVPSLKVFNSTISTGVQFRIRGFGSATNSSTDSDVAPYVDGVFIARPAAILNAFLDISNIEVLSGPQGTLFGRNAAMGAVSLSTNAPTAKTSFDASLEGGSYGTYKATVVANMPVSDDFAVRAAFLGSHTDGVFSDIYDGKRYGSGDNYVGRISAKWNITPSATWVVRVDASKTTGDGANALDVYTNTASASQLAALASFVTAHGGTAPVFSSTPSYTVNNYEGNIFNNDHSVGVTSNLNWDIAPKISLRLIDAYRTWTNNSAYPDAAATSLDLVNAQQYTKSVSTSHELQLVSAKDAFLGGKAGITSGIYYFHEVYDINVGFNVGSQFCGILPLPPFLVPACQGAPSSPGAYTTFAQTTDSYAAYAQANYSLLPNLELDLGGRVTHEEKSGMLSQSNYNAIAFSALVGNEGPEALSFSDTKPSYRASLSWHPTTDFMVFGTYSTGFKAGGFNAGQAGGTPGNPVSSLNAVSRTFASETAKDVELGFKSSFLDNKLIFNVTAFYTKLYNFQDRSFNGFAFLIRNAGDVRSQGVDMNGRLRALSNLTLDFAATYLDSIYARNTNAPGLEGCAANPATGGPANVACPLTQDLSGQLLPYAPKWQAHFGLNWAIGSISGFSVTATAGENYSSGFQTDTTLNPQAYVPGFATTDLRLGITSPDGKWKFDVFGSNVFNKHYLVATVAQPFGSLMPGVNNPVTGATVFRGFLGDPARFGARITASF